jgi:hypothetical protein
LLTTGPKAPIHRRPGHRPRTGADDKRSLQGCFIGDARLQRAITANSRFLGRRYAVPQAPMRDVNCFVVLRSVGKGFGGATFDIAAAEDRALQGCNPSAACGRYTAGPGPWCPGPVLPAPHPCEKSMVDWQGACSVGAGRRVGGALRLPITSLFPWVRRRRIGESPSRYSLEHCPGFKLLSVRGFFGPGYTMVCPIPIPARASGSI